LFWNQTGERQFFGPDSIREAEKQVEIIRENLKAAQSRQKSNVDPRRREVIMHTSECHLFGNYEGLMSEESYHLDLSDLSKFWNGKEK
jgi:hypothetical protein